MTTPQRLAGQLTRKAALAGAAVAFGLLLARTLAPDPFHKVDNMKAPDFDEAAAWLNTDKPLRIADLRGKIVLLDFWTFG